MNDQHRDAHGKLLPCCNPKTKKPSERHPLHAEWALNRWGITTEEYDRIFRQHQWDNKRGIPIYPYVNV